MEELNLNEFNNPTTELELVIGKQMEELNQ